MILTDKKKKVSLDEFMKLTDANIELIDGYVVEEESPTFGHQKISIDIVIGIANRLRKNKCGEVVTAPMDVFLGEQVVQPDILFISNERLNIIRDGRIMDVPDVVFEIISPSTAIKDTNKKFSIYEQHGAKEYFIVYPDDKMVIKYTLENGKYHEEYRKPGFIQSDYMQCEFNF